MNTLKEILQILFGCTGVLAVLVSLPLFFAFRWPAPLLWGLKLFVSAFSPFLALLGALTGVTGIWTGSVFISWLGIVTVWIYVVHLLSVTRPPAAATGFEKAFGRHWEDHIGSERKRYFLPRRTAFRLPSVPAPRLQQNIPFATVPDTARQLLCDLWQPPESVRPSGLAFIYLHGSAFYFLDKDFGTRPFFTHLAAQGHVIMDVAYRLSPETDIMGMVQDTRQAIVWMKANADLYGVHPERIVVGGGSAGGHLALLTAYTSGQPPFTRPDLQGKNSHVCAVISLYGTSDLADLYYHTNQHLTTRSVPGRPKKAVPKKMPAWLVSAFGGNYHRFGFDKGLEQAGSLPPLMGGHPDEVPERYAFLSPVNHVHPNCPPTLLVHGAHDIMAPVKSTRRLYSRLAEEQVQAVLHVLPQTDHGFDLVFPGIAPAAHNALYDVERFLALIAGGKGRVETKKPPTAVTREI